MESSLIDNLWLLISIRSQLWQNIPSVLLRRGGLLQRLRQASLLQLQEELVHLQRGQQEDLPGLKDAGGGVPRQLLH